jgi:glycosyltransferase involved in cell wall biosynthesis
MPSITALLHTSNSGLQLGRALETLHPCDEILIVDHQSTDETLQVAREYGARIVQSVAGVAPGHYLQFASSDWILYLEPNESLTESLAASLYEFKLSTPPRSTSPRSVFLREETAKGWIDLPQPETRLIPRSWAGWQGWLPSHDPSAEALEGRLLRFMDRRASLSSSQYRPSGQ